jgi:putative PEP-CTERM system TPR-repeat lipoprotein
MRKILITALSLLCVYGCGASSPEEHLDRAKGFIENQEFNAAVIELKNALQQSPDYAEARYQLGVLYEKGGDAPSAVKELERAMDLGYPPEALLVPLFRAKVNLGRYQEVLGAVEEMEAPGPQLVAVRGLAELREGDVQAAQKSFEQALESNPDTVDAHRGLAAIQAVRDPQAALQHLERAVAIEPRNRDAWLALASLQLGNEQAEAALDAFETARSLPGGQIHGGVGVVRSLVMLGRTDEALDRVNNLVGAYPRAPVPNYLKGAIHYQQGDLEQAVAALRQSQSTAPNYLPTMLLLGIALNDQGQTNQAISQLQRYVSAAPAVTQGSIAARTLLGQIFLNRGAPEETIRLLSARTDLLTEQSSSLLGAAYLRTGDYANAVRYARVAVEQAPDRAALHTQLAVSLMAAGNTAAAEAELETASSLDGDFVTADLVLIQTKLREGNAQQAVEAAKNLLAKDAENVQGMNLLGAAYLALGDRDAAVQAFQSAVAADPDNTPAVARLASLAAEEGRPDEAAQYYRDLLATSPGNEQAAVMLSREATARGDNEEAIRILQDARTANPSSIPIRLILGRLLLIEGQFAAANELADEALAIAPDNGDVQFLKVRTDVVTGNRAAARTNLRRLLNERGRLPRDGYILLAQLDYSFDDLDRSIAVLKDWLTQQPKDYEARALLSERYLEAEDYEAARDSFEQLIAEKETATALNNLAWIYQKLGDERAVATARRAHELAPDQAQVADTLGWILVSKGKFEEASGLLRSALAASGNHPVIAYHLGVALNGAGDPEGAAAVLEQVVAAEGEFVEREEARALLEKIRAGSRD